jgi:cyanophycin synthetase
MCQLAMRLDVTGRRLVVLAGPGDRRDEDLVEIARAAAGKFDRYICRRDDGLRGRDGDEVPRIIAAALREAGVPEAHIQQIPDEQEAVESALRMARAGDLLLVFGDQITRTWKQIIHFRPDGSQRPVTAEYAIPRLTETPAAPEPVLGDLASLVRDERGVRLARELDD